MKDQSHVGKLLPNKNAISAPYRKRDLKIQVPKPQIQDRGFSRAPENSEYLPNISPRMTSLTPSSRVLPRAGGGHSESQTKWLDDAKQQSYPLPLPPAAISNSSHVSRPNSASKSPSAPLRSPERAENVKSPGTPWKKGKLLSRGPLGDVYLGFNRWAIWVGCVFMLLLFCSPFSIVDMVAICVDNLSMGSLICLCIKKFLRSFMLTIWTILYVNNTLRIYFFGLFIY